MDEEAIEGELSRLRKKQAEAIKEIEFCIEFAESGSLVTAPILEGIKKRLK